jgi:Carboxypeptidase regulatory-like domain
MLTVQRYLIRLGKEFGLVALTLSLASGICSAASTAAVSGVVRDTQGVAQMGAMVEVLAAGSVSVASAFTDIYGRYRIANLVPGKYQVKATAALFVPATRNNLQLSTGMRATVNLTLNMLSDPGAWLPAKRRGPDEPGDDWTWTLRSAANRPILRMLDDGELVLVSAGAEEGSHSAPMARVSTMSGDGGFGEGGVHNVVALDRASGGGSDLMVRTDLAVAGNGHSASTELDAGYERKAALGNASRLVVSYASHPEIMSAGDAMGMQLLRMASAERMQLGDAVDVEAGGTVYAIHMAGDALTTQPFLRVTVHPGKVWAVQYRLATSRDLQAFDGLDSIKAAVPVATVTNGRICTESGTHQEFGVSRKAGAGQIRAAIYRDVIDHPAIAGTGPMSAGDMLSGAGSSGVVVDTATDSFRFLGSGYTTNGMSLAVSEPLTPSLWAALEYASGTALSTRNASAEGLSGISAGLHDETAQELTAALNGRVLHSGTKLRASYRWQPRHLVTAVAPYEALSDQAYLGFYVRQAVRWGDRLPPGIDATIDVTNLLAEGYQPFLSADGRTLYLAQSPRTVQAGLSFSF